MTKGFGGIWLQVLLDLGAPKTSSGLFLFLSSLIFFGAGLFIQKPTFSSSAMPVEKEPLSIHTRTTLWVSYEQLFPHVLPETNSLGQSGLPDELLETDSWVGVVFPKENQETEERVPDAG